MGERVPTVGLIVNPAAGRDIRRLVARGRFVPDEEKVNIVQRILAGLQAAGVSRVLAMPDIAGLARAATGQAEGMEIQFLKMPIIGKERDSMLAAKAMAEGGAAAIITLGGDGTSRAVASAQLKVPLVAVSTGTNNVFPVLVEGTMAGLAAGLVATGAVDPGSVISSRPMLEISIDGERSDIALIDVAVARLSHVGARAIWSADQIAEIFVSGTYPTSIGLASIASRLPVGPGEGVYVRLGEGGVMVSAPVTPGTFHDVPVKHWSAMQFGEPVAVATESGTLAVDGERSIVLRPGQTASVTLTREGPRVIGIDRTLQLAGRAGTFVSAQAGEQNTP